MKKFILPFVIIIIAILAIVIFSFKKTDEKPNITPDQTQTEIQPSGEITVNKTAVSVYEEYNIEPGSYEAYLLDQYSGDESFSLDDLDGDGIPDAIFKEAPPAL